MRPTLKLDAGTRAVWAHSAIRWASRVGRWVVVVAAVLVIFRGGVHHVPGQVLNEDEAAALLVASRLDTPAVPIARGARGDVVTVRTGTKGCYEVGVSDGSPIWPASPVVCPLLELVAAPDAGGALPAKARDTVVGWAREVVDGGSPKRWSTPYAPVPGGPWVDHLDDVTVDAAPIEDGAAIWVTVTATWDGDPFEIGWRVTVTPRGDDFEVATVGPATVGATPNPASTTTSTTGTTRGVATSTSVKGDAT